MSWKNDRQEHSMASRGFRVRYHSHGKKDLPVIIFDIDGTLVNTKKRWEAAEREASIGSREFWKVYMDADKLHLDKPIPQTAKRLQQLAKQGVGIVYVSGRNANLTKQTIEFLKKHGFPTGPVRLRKPSRTTEQFKTFEIQGSKVVNNVLAYVGNSDEDARIGRKTEVPFVKVETNNPWDAQTWSQIKGLVK